VVRVLVGALPPDEPRRSAAPSQVPMDGRQVIARTAETRVRVSEHSIGVLLEGTGGNAAVRRTSARQITDIQRPRHHCAPPLARRRNFERENRQPSTATTVRFHQRSTGTARTRRANSASRRYGKSSTSTPLQSIPPRLRTRPRRRRVETLFRRRATGTVQPIE
jgi:hypothetical protein